MKYIKYIAILIIIYAVMVYADMGMINGRYLAPETTTPTAITDHGYAYFKSDNRAYFQDGSGTEHRIKTSDYAGILADDNTTEMTILLQDAYEPVMIFDANMPEIISDGDFSNNHITIGTTADYWVNIHVNGESAGVNKIYEVDTFMIAASGTAITGATQANPCVMTAVAHGFSDGDRVKISGVSGMTQLNGQIYTVAGKTDDTFQLNDDNSGAINSGGYGVYSGPSGTVFLATSIDVAHTHRQFGAGANVVGSMSGGGIAALIGGDTLEAHMKNITDATNMTTESVQLSIIRQ